MDNEEIQNERDIQDIGKQEEEIQNELNDDQTDDLNEELLLDEQGENALIDADDNIQDFKEKVRKSGVVYLSHIPEGMTVGYLREKFQEYGVTRIFLAPENPAAKGKKRTYKEGWVEFSNKMFAKLCEYQLNGEVIGGKRNIPFRDDMWTIKYLNKFKWHHLIEKMSFNKKLREQRMKAEIAQARREANFIENKFEQSKIVNRKNKKRQREEDEGLQIENEIEENEEAAETEENKIAKQPEAEDTRFNTDKFKSFKRNFKQRKPIFNKQYHKK